MDPLEAYDEMRARLTALLAAADPDAATRPISSCPGWAVKDALAHLAGSAADIINGRLDGVGSDAWTDAQVAARKDIPLTDILKAWEQDAARLPEVIGGWPREFQALLVADAVVHELDIRDALGQPAAAGSASFALSLDHYLGQLAQRISAAGLPALRVDVGGDGDGRVLGEGEPAARVEGHPVDLLRGLTGRRSRDQILTMVWDGEPDAYIDIFSSYAPPD